MQAAKSQEKNFLGKVSPNTRTVTPELEKIPLDKDTHIGFIDGDCLSFDNIQTVKIDHVQIISCSFMTQVVISDLLESIPVVHPSIFSNLLC